MIKIYVAPSSKNLKSLKIATVYYLKSIQNKQFVLRTAIKYSEKKTEVHLVLQYNIITLKFLYNTAV